MNRAYYFPTFLWTLLLLCYEISSYILGGRSFLKAALILYTIPLAFDFVLKVGSGFRDFLLYRSFLPPSIEEDDERTRDDSLTLRETEYAMALQSCLLPIREGTRFMVEPYFPHRFARQFGLDQGVPAVLSYITREEREAGVGPSWWPSLWARFARLWTRC